MKIISIVVVTALCIYALADISISVFSYKKNQVGYNPQQIAFMNELVEDAQ